MKNSFFVFGKMDWEYSNSHLAEDDDYLFAKAMLGWGNQAGLVSERPQADGLIEFRESRFSTGSARQSLLVPPDWTKYRNAAIVRKEQKLLGSFDRKTAALREDVLFFAPGDAVYDAIMTNAEGCSRGRCSAFGVAGDYNYDGLVFIFNVEVPANSLLSAGIRLQSLSQFRMFLPLEQVIIPVSLTPESHSIPTQKVIDTLNRAYCSGVEHLGKRGAGRQSQSKLDQLISRTPPSQWEPLTEQCYKRAWKSARPSSGLTQTPRRSIRASGTCRSG